jgi:hypothetical protein
MPSSVPVLTLSACVSDDLPPLATALADRTGSDLAPDLVIEMMGVVTPEALAARLQDPAQGLVAVFVAPARMAVAEALVAGRAPQAALAAWSVRTRALLDLGQEGCALVSALVARQDPATAVSALSEVLGQDVALPPDLPPGPLAGPQADLAQLLAGLMVAADPAAQALDAALQEVCLPVVSPPDLVAEALAAVAAAAGPSAADLALALAAREAELAEFAYVEDRLSELDLILARLTEAQDLSETLQLRVVAAEAEVAEARARAAEQEAEAARLRNEMAERLAAADRETAALHDRIAALMRSTSWRISAPVRGIGRLLGR